MTDILNDYTERALKGEGVSPDEAMEIASIDDARIYEILSFTDRIRRHHKGSYVGLCSIANAKSGECGEDCSFCPQSAHNDSGGSSYPLLEPDRIVEAARKASEAGAGEFSIVTSGTSLESDDEIDSLADALRLMREENEMERCASLGILDRERLLKLKESGLESYHHNLETGRSFFPNICTTHSYDEDVESVRIAKELGFYICSGGLFGLGEGWADRVELAETLGELGVDSVPINFLNPRPGTPLEGKRVLTPIECLKIIAIYRFMLPTRDIVVCGGRAENLGHLQPLIFAAGANAVMVGDYLTTAGRNVEDDLAMIAELGLKTKSSDHSRSS